MIIMKNTSLLALAALIVITSAHPRAHSGPHGHHQSHQETATECVTLTMPPDAVAKMLTGTGGISDSNLADALQDLKSGQQQVKTVLLQELQAKVLEDLERSEIVMQLQEAQKKQTHMLQKMQLLLENIADHGVQSRPKPLVKSKGLVIHQSTLSQKIQDEAIKAATEAVDQYDEYEDICPFIMSAMEEHHNKYWECTVGRDYAAWVMANSGQFIKFSIGDLTFRIFRVLP